MKIKFEALVNELNQTKDENRIRDLFFYIAELLLNYGYISINNNRFIIREVEFYFSNKTSHIDQNIHGNGGQEKLYNWYFHSNLTGLDITIGNNGNIGGILIRSLFDNKNNKLIEGPHKVLQFILANINLYVFENNSFQFEFSEEQNYDELLVAQTARIGLRKECKYKQEPYRFVSVIPILSANPLKEKYSIIKNLIDTKKINKEIASKYYTLDNSTLISKLNKT